MPESLATEIVAALCAVKAYDLPDVCVELGLPAGTAQAAFQSKRRYVADRVDGLGQPALTALGEKVVSRYRTYGLEEAMEAVKPSVTYRIDEITRRAIIRELEQLGELNGHLGLLDFLSRVWPLSEMKRADVDPFNGAVTFEDAIDRHMIRNDDWSISDLFEALGAREVSDRRFGKCLEMVVAPLVRDEPDQQRYAEKINTHLGRAGYALRAVEEQSGYPVYRMVAMVGGVAGKAKNLIFAANGPKPELVFEDAVNNDIRIVRNEEFCLVFDDPIPNRGLLWTDLVAWWARKNTLNPDERETAVSLYKRLAQSLSSPPEKLLFRTYFRSLDSLGARLPALVPQVYLHYDPYTQRELRGDRRLPRQRMDFLILLSHLHRIVIEVDGKQHYAEGDQASPAKYGEMVSADRDLKLAGYEIFRFGGGELDGPAGEARVTAFFQRLFEKYQRA